MGKPSKRKMGSSGSSEAPAWKQAADKCFEMANTNKDGEKVLDAKEISNFIALGDDEDPDVVEFMRAADENHDGQINIEELEKYFKTKSEVLSPEEFQDFLEKCENKAKFASHH